MDNQDKKSWCDYGDDCEKQFLVKSFDTGLSFFRNPAKTENKYTHDYFGVFPVDLKTIRTRFNTADRYGISPSHAVTINRKDLKRYEDLYPNIILILDIDFGDVKTVRFVSVQTLIKFIKSKKSKEHFYQQRENDTAGNAKSSFVFDCRWFDELR